MLTAFDIQVIGLDIKIWDREAEIKGSLITSARPLKRLPIDCSGLFDFAVWFCSIQRDHNFGLTWYLLYIRALYKDNTGNIFFGLWTMHNHHPTDNLLKFHEVP